MKNLSSLNPITVSLIFIITAFMGVFSQNPIIISLFITGAVSLCLLTSYVKSRKIHLYALITVIGCALLNPLFSHNGKTVLLVINDNPITAEAFLYGLFMGLSVAASVYWFAVYTALMTTDKVVYSLGRFAPKTALMLTLALRFLPMYVKQAKEINDSQRAMGLYKDDTIISAVKGYVRVLSILLTNVIEKTIITADSMAAKGYKGDKRSFYSLFSFTSQDITLIIISLVFTALYGVVSVKGNMFFSFYPELNMPKADIFALTGFISYFVLILIPLMVEGGEKLRWHFLKSKISVSHIPAQGK